MQESEARPHESGTKQLDAAVKCMSTIDPINLRAFTWNPDPNRYNSYEPERQYATILHYIMQLTKFLGKFAFVPELTDNGNVHIHGMFVVTDRIGFYKRGLPELKKRGFVVNKGCYDVKGWRDYLSKTIDFMSQLFSDTVLPVPYTHENAPFENGIIRKCYPMCRFIMKKHGVSFTKTSIEKHLKKERVKKQIRKVIASCVQESEDEESGDEDEPFVININDDV